MIDIEQISNSVPEGNGYIGNDGLLHCLKCSDQLETILNIPLVGERKVRCICRCMAKERDAFEERKRQEERERNRRTCFAGSMMMSCTFESSQQAELMTLAENYAKNFSQFRKEGKGLLFYGEVGTGKSHFAACIANRLIDEDRRVLMTNFSTIVNKLQERFEGRQEYIDSLMKYDLLILDDLGAERSTDYMQEQIYNIIDARYRSGLPMIITTNLTGNELKNPSDIGNARIYDRILEKCHPVKVDGQSIRRQNLKADFGQMQMILKGD